MVFIMLMISVIDRAHDYHNRRRRRQAATPPPAAPVGCPRLPPPPPPPPPESRCRRNSCGRIESQSFIKTRPRVFGRLSCYRRGRRYLSAGCAFWVAPRVLSRRRTGRCPGGERPRGFSRLPCAHLFTVPPAGDSLTARNHTAAMCAPSQSPSPSGAVHVISA